MLKEVNRILRERGVLDADAHIGGLTSGTKESSAEEIADIIQAALFDTQAIEVNLDD